MDVRKTVFTKETITADEMGTPCVKFTHVAAMAVVRNPFAEIDQSDLLPSFAVGAQLGQFLTAELVKMLDRPPVCYGKPKLVRSAGRDGAWCRRLAPHARQTSARNCRRGKSLMPSNHKVGALDACIDLPLGYKDEAWLSDHIDTMTVWVPDAPRADEIVLCIGLSNGTRAHPRVGTGPSPS